MPTNSTLTDLVGRAAHALIELDPRIVNISVVVKDDDASISVYGMRCDRGHIHFAVETHTPWNRDDALERMFECEQPPDV